MQLSRTKANWIFNAAGMVMIATLAGIVLIPLIVPQPSVVWGVLQIGSLIANVIVWIAFMWMLFFFPRAEGPYETITATILLTVWIANSFILSIYLLGFVARWLS